jgi:hypothetical protein
MQDPGYGLPRIPLPRTWVNKAKRRAGTHPGLLNSSTEAGCYQIPSSFETKLSAFISLPKARYEFCRANL